MILSIPDYIAWHNVAGNLALFDTRDGTYHALNGSAAAIWRLIADGVAQDAIPTVLAGRYDVPLDRVEREVQAFFADALTQGLLAE